MKVLARQDLFVESDKAKVIQQDGERLLEVMKGQDSFSEKLLTIFKSTFVPRISSASSRTERVKTWSKFHQLRITSLPQLWGDFLKSIDDLSHPISPLLLQSVNLDIFQSLFIEHEKRETVATSSAAAELYSSVILTKEETNAMRYACGFVPYRLLKKYEKKSDEKSVQFVECLGNMAVAGIETDLMDYTRVWFDAVNRGGLFPLNDESFRFFTAVESRVRSQLAKSVLPSEESSSNCKEITITTTLQDEDVKFYWSIVSIDIENEDYATELLQEIITLWLTIRGFSVAASWMEQYKMCNHKTTKKSSSLRKGLKCSHPSERDRNN